MTTLHSRSLFSQKLRLWTRTVFFAILTLAIIFVSPVSALSDALLDFYTQNGIYYYNPEGTNNPCNSPLAGTSKPSGNQITWIGDSYTGGAYSIINEKFPGVDIRYQSGKKFAVDLPEGDGGKSGLTILEEMQSSGDTIRPYVVFALGTNDSSLTKDGQNQAEVLVNMLGAGHTIVFVTPAIADGRDYSGVINSMKAAANGKSNVIIADWATALVGHVSEYYDTSTSIHPNSTGYKAWVDVIYGALPGNVGTLSGSTNKDKIWNYFASANIPGVSDNPMVIAGILGNIQQESSFNPFVHGSYYGLFQTNFEDFLNTMRNAGLESYWGQSNVPQDIQDKAIKVQLDWLVAWDRFAYFKNNLTKVSNPSPESFAELFEVTVEIAVNGNYSIQDSGVAQVCAKKYNSSSCPYQYQGMGPRRDNARNIYNEAMTSMGGATSSTGGGSSSSGGSSNTVVWSDDGWLSENTGAFAGRVNIQSQNNGYTFMENSAGAFDTAGGKPNKILLYATEGSQGGYSAYSAGAVYPAHFTIDIKAGTIAQHFSILEPAVASAGYDTVAGVQIELVGYSDASHASDPYYLGSRSTREWDFLAVFLKSLAEKTGIPLTSSLDWTTPTQLDPSAFVSYTGVLGNMHAPSDTEHTDPGDIWQYINGGLTRNPSASSFATNNNASQCYEGGGNGELVSGGMTLAQAKDFMEEYRSIANYFKNTAWSHGMQMATLPSGETIKLYFSNCNFGPLHNCSTFSQYFVNRYTTKGPSMGETDGKGMAYFLANSYGFPIITEPEPYAVFSYGESGDGHTGVILGIDAERGVAITGEAHCTGASSAQTAIEARERPLSQVRGYRLISTNGFRKGGI